LYYGKIQLNKDFIDFNEKNINIMKFYINKNEKTKKKEEDFIKLLQTYERAEKVAEKVAEKIKEDPLYKEAFLVVEKLKQSEFIAKALADNLKNAVFYKKVEEGVELGLTTNEIVKGILYNDKEKISKESLQEHENTTEETEETITNIRKENITEETEETITNKNEISQAKKGVVSSYPYSDFYGKGEKDLKAEEELKNVEVPPILFAYDLYKSDEK
jgi:hypothetical protein